MLSAVETPSKHNQKHFDRLPDYVILALARCDQFSMTKVNFRCRNGQDY